MTGSLTPRWWTEDGDALATAVWAVTDEVRKDYSEPLQSRLLNLLTIYNGGVLEDFAPRFDVLLTGEQEVLSYNVCQSCADTQIANLVSNRVNPLFVTEGGNHEQRQRAEGMQRAIEGLFHEHGIWRDRAQRAAIDGCVWGLAATYVWPDVENMRVVYERVLPWEVMVHPGESMRADPRSVGILLRVDRGVLRAAFADDPEAVRAIDDAEPAPCRGAFDDEDSDGLVADRVLVATWWHLPSGAVDRDQPEAWGRDADGEPIARDKVPHDGRKVIAVQGHVLADEPWPYEYAPIAFFRPHLHVLGFRGRGIVEQLVGIQYEIVQLMQRISDIIHLYAVPLIYLWSQAGVNERKIASNALGRVVSGRAPAGQAIQYIVPPSVPSELWLQLDRLIESAYRQVALSEMSAQAKRPQGIEHAPGMQLLQDVESQRHMPTFRAWEGYHTDLARLSVDALRQLARAAKERGIDMPRLLWHDDAELKRIDWTDEDLGEANYYLQAWPTNLLPQTPAARLDRVMWMFERGMVDRDTAASMLPFPDIKAAFSVAQSALRDANARIDLALQGKEAEATPSAYSNLALLVSTAVSRYQAMFADGAKPAELDRLRALIVQAEMQLERAKAAAAPPALPPGGGGEAPPVFAPTSPLVPPPGAAPAAPAMMG